MEEPQVFFLVDLGFCSLGRLFLLAWVFLGCLFFFFFPSPPRGSSPGSPSQTGARQCAA